MVRFLTFDAKLLSMTQNRIGAINIANYLTKRSKLEVTNQRYFDYRFPEQSFINICNSISLNNRKSGYSFTLETNCSLNKFKQKIFLVPKN
jgi:hypothetical protein